MERINRKKLELTKILSEPFFVGESVMMRGTLIGNRSDHPIKVIIQSIDGEDVVVKDTEYRLGKDHNVKLSDLKKETFHVGYSPMTRPTYRLQNINFTLESIVFACGFDKRERKFNASEILGDITMPELNWNPYVIQSDGSKFYYQRDLVWELEDKQSFIDSIYNNISLGKLILRERGYEWSLQQAKKGETEFAYKDIVDGKQRLNCIFSFLQDEFPDSNGYYYSEFSQASMNQFLDHQLLGYAVLDENATDKDVIDCFLRTNFAGVQMSKSHIEYVKNIKL